MSTSRVVRPITLTTADGCSLEGDLAMPTDAVRGCAVVCHPHPLYGGDRHNPVVDARVRALSAVGVAALRFDFRGVGRSTGRHGLGVDERLDVLAALDALDVAEFPASIPRFLLGYSFGAAVALGVLDARVRAWVGVAAPLAMVDAAAGADGRPRLLLVPEYDQYCDPDKARVTTDGWAQTTIEVVPQADHFLGGRVQWAAERAVAWLVAAGPEPINSVGWGWGLR